MTKPYTSSLRLSEFKLWEKLEKKRHLYAFDIELTARCPSNCRHCYINLPPGDKNAIKKELSAEETTHTAREAAHRGALWCLLTGGEPLLRRNFQKST